MSDDESRLRRVLVEKRKVLRSVWDRMPASPTHEKWTEWVHEEQLASQDQQDAKLALEHQMYLDRGWESPL